MKPKLLLILSVFIWTVSHIVWVGEAWAAGTEASNCQKPFLSPDSAPFPFIVTSNQVREFFANRKNVIKYREREGYFLFSKKTPNINRMDYIFRIVSKALGKDRFRKLHWQMFYGSAEEFQDLRGKILDAEGNVRKEYSSLEGQALFADRHYSGNMFKTFQNVSAVLGGALAMQQWGLTEWKSFKGSSKQYRDLVRLFQPEIQDDDPLIFAGETYPEEEQSDRMPFQGAEGQREVADLIFDGDRKKAYHNVSLLRELLLGSRKAFKKLKWFRNP